MSPLLHPVAPDRFDPFENRLCRDIQNEMAEDVLQAIGSGQAAGLPAMVKASVPDGAGPPVADYVQTRLKKYRAVGTQIRSAGIRPADTFAVALVLWDQRLFFETHEWLERTWRTSRGSEKGACQALILSAGTYQHLEYGRQGAAAKMARRAAAKLVRFREAVPEFFNIDLLLDSLEAGDPEPPQLGAAHLVATRGGKQQ